MSFFVALPVVAEALERLAPPPVGIRRVHPADLHLTVAFLGECSVAQARAAFAALGWEGAIDAELGEVGPLGAPGRYSVLAAGLGLGRERVEAAMGPAREAACAAAGVAVDPRPPLAHVTLARVGRRSGAEARALGMAWAGSLAVRGTPIRLDRVALYGPSADRGLPGRPSYVLLEDRRLGPSGA